MMNNTDKLYFPIFIDLSEKHIVVVGAGKIASRRVRTLLEFAGKITVVAPEISEEILAMAGKGPVQLKKRAFEEADLDGTDMVLAITDDKELNKKIGTLCKEKKIPVNTSHDKDLCDFYFPGVVQKENVVVGVTASGKDHKQAKEVTEKIREALDNMEEEENDEN